MRFFRKITLDFATRLYLWTTLVILVTFCGIAAIFRSYSDDREEQVGGRYAGFMLNEMVHGIGERLLTVENIVKSYEPLVKGRVGQPDSLINIVERWALGDSLVVGGALAFTEGYYPDRGKYFMPYVTRTLGNKPVSKYLGSEEYDYFGMEWYNSTKEARRGTWSEPYYDDGGGDVMMVTYSLPLFDKYGNMYAMMTADMSIDELVRDIAKLAPYRESYSFVLSKRGTFIVHPRRTVILNQTIFSYADSLHSESMKVLAKDMFSGRAGYDRRMVRGKDVLVNYTTLPRTGWIVVTFSPYSEVVRHLGTVTGYMLAVLLVGLVVLLIVLRYVIKRNTQSLDKLTDAAYKIARGDFSTKLPRTAGDASIRTLIDAFTHMQQSLTDYISSLRQSTLAQARIQSELDIAHAIQKETMPRTFPTSADRAGIDVYAMLDPVNTIGGDYYDFMLADGHFYFCIGTVSCSGSVSTSLLLTVVRSVFRSSISAGQEPEVTIKSMSNVLRDNPETDLNATVFVGSLDLATGILVYSNASHNAPLLVYPEGLTEFLPGSPSLPLGVDVLEECIRSTITLRPGSRLVFFTDGIITATNAGGAAYTDYTLYHTVNIIMANHPGLSAQELVRRIDRSVREHRGNEPQHRDQTLMTFTYKGTGSTFETELDAELDSDDCTDYNTDPDTDSGKGPGNDSDTGLKE